jgi:hypothetical protein
MLVKGDVTGSVDPIGRQVKTVTSFVMSEIDKVDTHRGTQGEFMSGCSGEVRVALATKHTEMLIRGLRAE